MPVTCFRFLRPDLSQTAVRMFSPWYCAITNLYVDVALVVVGVAVAAAAVIVVVSSLSSPSSLVIGVK